MTNGENGTHGSDPESMIISTLLSWEGTFAKIKKVEFSFHLFLYLTVSCPNLEKQRRFLFSFCFLTYPLAVNSKYWKIFQLTPKKGLDLIPLCLLRHSHHLCFEDPLLPWGSRGTGVHLILVHGGQLSPVWCFLLVPPLGHTARFTSPVPDTFPQDKPPHSHAKKGGHCQSH